MEIAPIPGIRALPAVRAPQREMQAPTVFDIDGSEKPGDGEGQQNGRKAAGAEEDGTDDLLLEGEEAAEDGRYTESGGEARGGATSEKRVDYFA